eukprot:6300621-Pyramimonas_sp.AAC.1
MGSFRPVADSRGRRSGRADRVPDGGAKGWGADCGLAAPTSPSGERVVLGQNRRGGGGTSFRDACATGG